MRILFVCYLDTATSDLSLFLTQEWEKIGHQVELFPFDIEYSNKLIGKFWGMITGYDWYLRSAVIEKRIEKACQRQRPDVLLISGRFVTVESMIRLRSRYGCITGSWLGYNNLLEGNTAAFISNTDFVIVHDSYLVPVVRGSRYGRNPNVFFLPSMADPREHQPLDLSEEDRQRYGGDIAFIGGISDNRIEALRRLTGYDLRIWGGHWQKAPDLTPFFRNEPVYGLKKTKIYNAAGIVLNIEDSEKQINGVSQRIAEVPASGGFVLTDWRRDLELTPLVEGESIVCYRSLDEMREKVDYYLNHPEERKAIAEKGRKIVLESMTYNHVAKKLAMDIQGLVEQRPRQTIL